MNYNGRLQADYTKQSPEWYLDGIALYPMLNKDINAWIIAEYQEKHLCDVDVIDCLYCELQSSINGQYYSSGSKKISEEQADYLREIFLGIKRGRDY